MAKVPASWSAPRTAFSDARTHALHMSKLSCAEYELTRPILERQFEMIVSKYAPTVGIL